MKFRVQGSGYSGLRFGVQCTGYRGIGYTGGGHKKKNPRTLVGGLGGHKKKTHGYRVFFLCPPGTNDFPESDRVQIWHKKKNPKSGRGGFVSKYHRAQALKKPVQTFFRPVHGGILIQNLPILIFGVFFVPPRKKRLLRIHRVQIWHKKKPP